MAKEYIEREAATAYAPLSKHLRDYQTMNLDDAWENGYDFAIRQLSSIPAADVAPVVHARWNRRYDDFMKSTYDTCSNCGMEYFGAKGFRFCPNCGADMREVQDG